MNNYNGLGGDAPPPRERSSDPWIDEDECRDCGGSLTTSGLGGCTCGLEEEVEYDAAAEYYARHNTLSDSISAGVIGDIFADQKAFLRRVGTFRLLIAIHAR